MTGQVPIPDTQIRRTREAGLRDATALRGDNGLSRLETSLRIGRRPKRPSPAKGGIAGLSGGLERVTDARHGWRENG